MGLTLKGRLDGGVQVVDAGAPGTAQHFTPEYLERGLAGGWLTVSGSRIVILAQGGALIYRLNRPPGTYCCHCQAPAPDSVAALAHVMAAHPGRPSPDSSSPFGFRTDHFYATTRLE